MNIEAKQFLTGSGRRVLTNEGRQGMGGVAGVGSSTEKMQGYVAEAIFENCGQLDNQQLDDIISWIQLYKSRMMHECTMQLVFLTDEACQI